MELLGVDGINGDTMDGVGPEWWEEGNKRGMQLALEPEVLFNNFTYLQVAQVFFANAVSVGCDVLGLLVPRLQQKGRSHLKKNGKKRGHCPLLATPPP